MLLVVAPGSIPSSHERNFFRGRIQTTPDSGRKGGRNRSVGSFWTTSSRARQEKVMEGKGKTRFKWARSSRSDRRLACDAWWGFGRTQRQRGSARSRRPTWTIINSRCEAAISPSPGLHTYYHSRPCGTTTLAVPSEMGSLAICGHSGRLTSPRGRPRGSSVRPIACNGLELCLLINPYLRHYLSVLAAFRLPCHSDDRFHAGPLDVVHTFKLRVGLGSMPARQ